jgi:hypothetical protein
VFIRRGAAAVIRVGAGSMQGRRIVFVQPRRSPAFPFKSVIERRKTRADSRLFLRAKLLENRIPAQRVPEGIEP